MCANRYAPSRHGNGRKNKFPGADIGAS